MRSARRSPRCRRCGPRWSRTGKQKWLEVAKKYPNLSADDKRRVHERMEELAKLTPEQRRVARENFRRAYELLADQRRRSCRSTGNS